MITKEAFEEKYNLLKEQVIDAMDNALENVLSKDLVDWEKAHGNFRDVYPLMAAVLHSEAHGMIYGGSYESTKREIIRKKKAFERNLAVWKKEYPNYYPKI